VHALRSTALRCGREKNAAPTGSIIATAITSSARARLSKRTVRAIERRSLPTSGTGSVAEPALFFIAFLLASAGSRYIIASAIARWPELRWQCGRASARLRNIEIRNCHGRHCEERKRRSIHASASGAMDCFKEPVIGCAFARTRWLAMTASSRTSALASTDPGPLTPRRGFAKVSAIETLSRGHAVWARRSPEPRIVSGDFPF
jgi:hypothetical protein